MRSQNRRRVIRIRETLPRRDSHNGQLTKPVEPILGSNPDIAFTILKEGGNVISRKAVGPGKHICPVLVDMQEPVLRYDPKATLAVLNHLVKQPGTGQRDRFHSPGNEPPNSAPSREQEFAVPGFGQSEHPIRH
jgi:hypothetical protein